MSDAILGGSRFNVWPFYLLLHSTLVWLWQLPIKPCAQQQCAWVQSKLLATQRLGLHWSKCLKKCRQHNNSVPVSAYPAFGHGLQVVRVAGLLLPTGFSHLHCKRAWSEDYLRHLSGKSQPPQTFFYPHSLITLLEAAQWESTWICLWLGMDVQQNSSIVKLKEKLKIICFEGCPPSWPTLSAEDWQILVCKPMTMQKPTMEEIMSMYVLNYYFLHESIARLIGISRVRR